MGVAVPQSEPRTLPSAARHDAWTKRLEVTRIGESTETATSVNGPNELGCAATRSRVPFRPTAMHHASSYVIGLKYAVAALCIALSGIANADGPASRGAPPKSPNNQSPARPASATDGLDATFMAFELLGIRFRPPTGSISKADGTGANATWIVTEKTDPTRFIMKVSRLVASDAASSPAQQIDAYIKTVSERPAPNAVFQVRSRKEFDLDKRPAAILYTSLREGSGADEVSAVQGYFIVQVGPNEFIIMSTLMAESEFNAMSGVLERAFRTLEVSDPEAIARDRAMRLGRGAHLLEGLDEDALRRALDPSAKGKFPAPRWYRISRNDPKGEAQEVGYMTIVAVEAAQGVANPDRPENKWTKDEREMGLLVRVQVRTLVDAAGKAVTDTDGRYWLRWDRGRELWTVRTTTRNGRSTKTSTQLGIRTAPTSGSPRPVLEVAEVSTAEGGEPRRWPLPPAGYLSQAESLLLPRLLGRPDAATDYGFYCFDTRSGRLAQRIDRATPGTDGFTVLTQPTLESTPVTQRVDAHGILLRSAGEDGSVVEATTGEALLALWQRKGLPTQ